MSSPSACTSPCRLDSFVRSGSGCHAGGGGSDRIAVREDLVEVGPLIGKRCPRPTPDLGDVLLPQFTWGSVIHRCPRRECPEIIRRWSEIPQLLSFRPSERSERAEESVKFQESPLTAVAGPSARFGCWDVSLTETFKNCRHYVLTRTTSASSSTSSSRSTAEFARGRRSSDSKVIHTRWSSPSDRG